RAAMRQAPDVLVVGEMRDTETMRIALGAAETGHLVFSTVHTTDVASTVSRMADSFPIERQPTIRQELSMALAAVLTQTLLPRRGAGRVPAAGLLMVSYGARQPTRKSALHPSIGAVVAPDNRARSPAEDPLARPPREERVDWAEARPGAPPPEECEPYLRSVPWGGGPPPPAPLRPALTSRR